MVLQWPIQLTVLRNSVGLSSQLLANKEAIEQLQSIAIIIHRRLLHLVCPALYYVVEFRPVYADAIVLKDNLTLSEQRSRKKEKEYTKNTPHH